MGSYEYLKSDCFVADLLYKMGEYRDFVRYIASTFMLHSPPRVRELVTELQTKGFDISKVRQLYNELMNTICYKYDDVRYANVYFYPFITTSLEEDLFLFIKRNVELRNCRKEGGTIYFTEECDVFYKGRNVGKYLAWGHEAGIGERLTIEKEVFNELANEFLKFFGKKSS